MVERENEMARISKAKAIDGVLLKSADPQKVGYSSDPTCIELMADDWPAIENALKRAGFKVVRAT